jgi:frataxin
MTDSSFERLADSLLSCLEEQIGEHAEADLQGSVLTVQTAEIGIWIINKHAATQQVWLSSPKSGARHYAFDPATGLWQDTRGGADLLTVLSAEFGANLDWTPA